MKNVLAEINLKNNPRNFVQQQKEAAREYGKLYHCCPSAAFLNIIEKKQFWLSNLTEVNDRDEIKAIDSSRFRKKFYVGCFTYDDNVGEDHWDEYASLTDGILFSVKKEWFLRRVYFLDGDYKTMYDEPFQIFPHKEDADQEFKQKALNGYRGGIHPYFVFDFDFYKIYYSNSLVQKIENEADIIIGDVSMPIHILFPIVAGIIKKEEGISYRVGRPPRRKVWKDEHEVRLKVGIERLYELDDKDVLEDNTKISVDLSPNAFQEIDVRFSPQMSEKRKKEIIKKIDQKIPEAIVNVLS